MPAPKDPIKYIEWKKKLSLSQMGENNPNFGKHLSEETKKKLSLSKSGENCSKETREKMSDAAKQRPPISEETKKKMSDMRRGENNPLYKGGKTEQCICEECGKVFFLYISQIKSGMGTYCNKECQHKSQSKLWCGENSPTWRGGKKGCVCQNCGEIYYTYNNIKYCSKDCYDLYQSRNRIERVCQNCGKIYYTKSSKSKVFCNKECMKKDYYSIENMQRRSGLWYGNIKYSNMKQYCEKWNKDLWIRIDAFQEHKSAISGKTRIENNNISLSRHHVYWQEKACCEWDEDAQGYYAMINIGTRNKPSMYKYYIKGDPNKFVLLTKSEHCMISKDKLKWIKYFEDKIEDEWDGKCYYTKEEFEELNSII